MLIDIGIACAWIAISAAGALALISLSRGDSIAVGTLGADEPCGEQANESWGLAHEDIYPADPYPVVRSSHPLGLVPVGGALR